MVMRKVLHHRNDIDYMCQENKEEEDLPELKIISMHQHSDLKTI